MSEITPAAEGANWAAAGGFLVAVFAFLSTWIWRERGSVNSRFEDLHARLDAGYTRFREVDDRLAAFRLEVAKEYVSHEDLREMDKRITQGFADLRTAVDALTKAFNDHRAEEARR